MYPITKVTGADIVFPARVDHLMPPYEELIGKRKDPEHRRLEEVAQRAFFKGMDAGPWKPKEGVNKDDALRQIQCILGSFEPKHEHKIAGVAFLLGEWFEGVE
jgi:hypothetical protein